MQRRSLVEVIQECNKVPPTPVKEIIEKIKGILASDPDYINQLIDYQNEDMEDPLEKMSISPLHWAILTIKNEKTRNVIVNFLITRGADVNQLAPLNSPSPFSALSFAVKMGMKSNQNYRSTIQILIKRTSPKLITAAKTLAGEEYGHLFLLPRIEKKKNKVSSFFNKPVIRAGLWGLAIGLGVVAIAGVIVGLTFVTGGAAAVPFIGAALIGAAPTLGAAVGIAASAIAVSGLGFLLGALGGVIKEALTPEAKPKLKNNAVTRKEIPKKVVGSTTKITKNTAKIKPPIEAVPLPDYQPMEVFEGQTIFIKLMHLAGYESANLDGVCFGLSCMRMQGVLSGEPHAVDDRIKALADFANDKMGGANNIKWFDVSDKDSLASQSIQEKFDEKFNTLSPETQKDFKVFFDGIMAYQYFLEEQKISTSQEVMKIAPIVQSIKLEKEKGGIFKVDGSFCNIYRKDELAIYFQTLRNAFQQGEMQEEVPMILHSGLHVIQVSYNPITDQWIHFNPTLMPAQHIHGNDFSAIANLVEAAFPVPYTDQSNSNTVFSTEIFGTNNNKPVLLKSVNILKDDQQWQNLQSLEKHNLEDVNGISLLYLAVYKNDVPLVKSLLEKGADINKLSKTGHSALHLAVQNSSEEMVTLLLDNQHIDPNPQMKETLYTPLHLAVNKGLLTITKLLLNHPKINKDATSKWNEKPIDKVPEDQADGFQACFNEQPKLLREFRELKK